MKLSDARVLVTGGASGMGRHFSLEFAGAGAAVAAFDLNEEGLAALAEEAKGLPGKIYPFKVDVSDEAGVEQAVGDAWEALGGLDGVVNNAGIFRDGLLVKKDKKTGEVRTMSLEQWQSVIDVDLTGPFLCTRALASRHVEAGGGPAVVVNISSVARHGNAGQSNYSAAKAGLVADTMVWGRELARHGIRVGAVAPGFVDTPILQAMRPEVLDMLLKGVPLRRMGAPGEIFAAVRFIFECDYFTGRCVEVDGGVQL